MSTVYKQEGLFNRRTTARLPKDGLQVNKSWTGLGRGIPLCAQKNFRAGGGGSPVNEVEQVCSSHTATSPPPHVDRQTNRHYQTCTFPQSTHNEGSMCTFCGCKM